MTNRLEHSSGMNSKGDALTISGTARVNPTTATTASTTCFTGNTSTNDSSSLVLGLTLGLGLPLLVALCVGIFYVVLLVKRRRATSGTYEPKAMEEEGENCEVRGPCADEPCVWGECSQEGQMYWCDCDIGYEGSNCSQEIDWCQEQPCKGVNSTCTQDRAGYTCLCGWKLVGDNCEIVLPSCSDGVCANGAGCEDSATDYTCSCKPGYTDRNCTTDIDDCLQHGCLHASRCVDGVNQYTCDCQGTGFWGKHCEEDINECSLSTPCNNGGSCTNIPGSYYCNCTERFLGRNCSYSNPCYANPCTNGGTCAVQSEEQSIHVCLCVEKFVGAMCELENPCLVNQTSPCVNQGRCVPMVTDQGIADYSCDCEEDWQGKDCDIMDPSKMPISDSSNIIPYIVGPVVGVILIILIVVLIVFLLTAKKKRATRGTYSPSRQELSGSRVELGNMMKPPPEERLI